MCIRDSFRKAADGYRENNIPIDMVYMDIDYMEDYKDFTVNQENFPGYWIESNSRNRHLLPYNLLLSDARETD